MKTTRPADAAGRRGRRGAISIRILSVVAMAAAVGAAVSAPAMASTQSHQARSAAWHVSSRAIVKHGTRTIVEPATAYAAARFQVTARVLGGRTPGGYVRFTAGRRYLCTGKLYRGVARCWTFFIYTGRDAVRGTFRGDPTHWGSWGVGFVRVIKAPTTTNVSVVPPKTTLGTSVQIVATVKSASTVPAGGRVTFRLMSGTLLCGNVPVRRGSATCAYTFGRAGHYTVKANYFGDAHHNGSGGVASVVINKPVNTTTAIAGIAPTTVLEGKSAVVTVHVTAADGSVPTGLVQVAPTDVVAPVPPGYDCTVTLTAASKGTGTCTVTPPNPSYGQITYEASYAGDNTYNGSVSTGSHILTVQETTTTTVTPNTATAGTAVTFTAAVVAGAGDISPAVGGTGTVTFTVNGSAVPGCTNVALTYNKSTNENLATCAYTFAAAGNDTVVAKYSGDPYNVSSTGTVSVTVGA